MTAEEIHAPTPRLAQLRAERSVAQFAAEAAEQMVVEATPRAVTTVGTLPSPVNLVLYQGDDFYLDLLVRDPSGNPVDVDGQIPKADIRLAAGATSVLAAFVATVVDNFTISLHLTSAESTKLTASAVWDVQITDLAGVVTTLAAGSVTVVRQVTQ
jgi:hypothetical protein